MMHEIRLAHGGGGRYSHQLIDAGADVIFGHGPHVLRAIEIYNERFIAYSLGNFCTYGRFNLDGPNGLSAIMNIKVTETGEFIEGKIIPLKQSYQNGVKIDPENNAILGSTGAH